MRRCAKAILLCDKPGFQPRQGGVKAVISGFISLGTPRSFKRVRKSAGVIDMAAPDAWGRRVMARDQAKRRKDNPVIAPLTEMDYLLAVDDISRIGALRLCNLDGRYLRTVEEGRRGTPPLLESNRISRMSETVERKKPALVSQGGLF